MHIYTTQSIKSTNGLIWRENMTDLKREWQTLTVDELGKLTEKYVDQDGAVDSFDLDILLEEFETMLKERNHVFNYRIKPAEKVVRWLWIHYTKYTTSAWIQSLAYMTDKEAAEYFSPDEKYKKLYWSREEFDE
jgi:hypothetical protein